MPFCFDGIASAEGVISTTDFFWRALAFSFMLNTQFCFNYNFFFILFGFGELALRLCLRCSKSCGVQLPLLSCSSLFFLLLLCRFCSKDVAVQCLLEVFSFGSPSV